MYKILCRINAPTRKEGLARSTYINRLMLAFIFLYLVSTATILGLKSEIFRHPNQDPSSSYSTLEITFLVIEALRVSFTVILIIVFVKVINMYMESVKGKTSDGHILKAKFFKYSVPIIFGLGSVYSHMLLPVYYL
jgi:flagellar biosynthesis protein FlhB